MNAAHTGGLAASIDSDELRMLHTLSTTGSLTQTATQLGLSQPAVSQRIKRIEARLAVPLIERQGRGIRLTPAGQILAEHGLRVVAEVDAALAAIEDLRGDRGGALRMAGFPSASATVIPQLMRLLRDRAPGVTFQYREAEPPEAIQLLRDGDVDCALIFDYDGSEPLPASCTFTPLWSEELWLVMPDERAEGRSSASLASFSTDPWIAGCTKCRGHLLSVAAASGFEPDIIQETDNMPAMIAMVAAGSSVALVPGLALAHPGVLPSGACAIHVAPTMHRTIGIVSIDTANVSPAARLAGRMLAEIDGTQWGLSRYRRAA